MKITSKILLASLLVASNSAFGEVAIESAVFVDVESKDAPVQAVGYLLSAGESKQVAKTSVEKIADKLYRVSFSVPSEDQQAGSLATAMTISSSGELAFGNVTPLGGDATLSSVPDCAAEDASSVVSPTQMGALRSLVEIRTARSDLAHLKLSRILNGSLLRRLQKLEEAFGLSHATELSPDLNPDELVERMYRLNEALKAYKIQKK